ncbi:MAG: hypothetical protein V7K68_00770 [Nostoc sp.]|uniref:hypothetical protein n=1 Tax=Nostoc sp. TaxID=1180 RepID=UPI002FFAB42B
MSVESFKEFFQSFLNDPVLVNHFSENVSSLESGIQFAIDRGAEKGYQFSQQDVQEGLTSLKSEWLAQQSPQESRVDAGGWSDGEAGAAIGDAINTYIDDDEGDSGGW